MTIAAELDTLAARCRAAAPHPAHLSPREGHREGWLDHLACALDDLAGRARLIEAQPVPLGAELDNVIVLSRRRRDIPSPARGRGPG